MGEVSPTKALQKSSGEAVWRVCFSFNDNVVLPTKCYTCFGL